MYIHQYLYWKGGNVYRNGTLLYTTDEPDLQQVPVSVYQQSGISYTKFFKMDLLSRVAFLAAELTIPGAVQEDKDHIATVISTTSGCLDVDHKFDESRKTLASPALFVYTLPNIMLGEICIRNGFKGEQMCTATDGPDAAWLDFYVSDLLQNRGTEACLCGYAEATARDIKASLLWVSKTPAPLPFNMASLQHILTPDL